MGLPKRKLTLALGKPSGEVRRLAGSSLPVPELVLVLPDRSRGRSMKMRPWNAKVTAEEHSVVFEPDLIDSLAGEAAPTV